MKDYNELIKRVKYALAELDSPESALKQLYKQAIEKSRSEYESSLGGIKTTSDAAINSADTVKNLAAKNAAIAAEQKGTLSAGVNLALDDARNRHFVSEVEDIAADADLQAHKAAEKLDLDVEKQGEKLRDAEAKQRVAYEKELNTLETGKAKEEEQARKEAEKLAAAEKAAAEKAAAAKAAEKAAAEKAAAKAAEAAEKAKAAAAEAAAKAAAKAEAEKAKGYKPTVTAKELAKMINERYPGDAQKAAEFVDGLMQLYNFDEGYLKDLEFALAAYAINAPKESAPDNGETTDNKTTGGNTAAAKVLSAAKVKELLKGGEDVFKSGYKRVYDAFAARGESGLQLAKKSMAMAKDLQMDFFYRSSPTLAEFKRLCKEAKLTDAEIAEYANRVDFINNHTDGKLILGEFL